MKRRDFITLVGRAAVAWPLDASAQPAGRARRVGVLMSLAADDRDSQIRLGVFLQALRELGWNAERNLQIDVRWGADDAARTRDYAAELVALAPDVILASGSTAAGPLQRATRRVPIVFVQVAEPSSLGAGMTGPDANVTGIASIEYGMSAKWLELLKEIGPRITRAVVIRDPTSGAGQAQLGAMESVAASLGLALFPVGVRDGDQIGRAIGAVAREPNGGLVVTTSTRASAHRDLIVTLAARHRLPAVYPFRFYVESGGLISYGADWADQYRRAAAYVDRILKGAKPADLPVQTPAKYELVINLKTARALGLEVPPSIRMRADAVVE
jgi:putative tryptophan/tyrosine transport system substrate-binding protein